MATTLEIAMYEGFVTIFGGSPILFAMVALGLFFACILLARIPIVVAVPFFAMAMIIVGYAVPEFRLVIGLVMGVVIAGWLYSMWGR